MGGGRTSGGSQECARGLVRRARDGRREGEKAGCEGPKGPLVLDPLMRTSLRQGRRSDAKTYPPGVSVLASEGICCRSRKSVNISLTNVQARQSGRFVHCVLVEYPDKFHGSSVFACLNF